MTEEQKKQTHPWQSNRWTIQLNHKSVRDWREARDYQGGVVRQNFIGTSAPAAPVVLVGAHI